MTAKRPTAAQLEARLQMRLAESILQHMLKRVLNGGWSSRQKFRIKVEGNTVYKPEHWRGKKCTFNFEGLWELALDDAGIALPLKEKSYQWKAAKLVQAEITSLPGFTYWRNKPLKEFLDGMTHETGTTRRQIEYVVLKRAIKKLKEKEIQ